MPATASNREEFLPHIKTGHNAGACNAEKRQFVQTMDLEVEDGLDLLGGSVLMDKGDDVPNAATL